MVFYIDIVNILQNKHKNNIMAFKKISRSTWTETKGRITSYIVAYYGYDTQYVLTIWEEIHEKKQLIDEIKLHSQTFYKLNDAKRFSRNFLT